MILRKSHVAFIQKILPWIGSAIAISSLFFIGMKIKNNLNVLNIHHVFNFESMLLLFFCSLVFGFISVFIALAWCRLIKAEGEDIDYYIGVSIFAKSQIAKYFPGNVFHFLGRQLLARQYGYSHNLLMKSTLWEIVLHALAAGLVGSLLLVAFMPSNIALLPTVLVIFIILVGLPALSRLIETERMYALALYATFHILAALIFAIVLNFFSPTSLSLSNFCIGMGAYILAWLVGFITPGAPGGLGVRELVLYMLISPWLGDNFLVIAIAFSRIITTVGDVIFFGLGYLLYQKKQIKFT